MNITTIAHRGEYHLQYKSLIWIIRIYRSHSLHCIWCLRASICRVACMNMYITYIHNYIDMNSKLHMTDTHTHTHTHAAVHEQSHL